MTEDKLGDRDEVEESESGADPTDGPEESANSRTSKDGVLPEPRISRILTVVLVAVFLVAVGGVVYVAATPTQEATDEPFTEFYILGTDGNASDYPTELTVGESGEFVVGITNHEQTVMDYTVVVRLGEQQVTRRDVRVPDETTWENTTAFTMRESGQHRLQILLFKNGGTEGEPDDTLRLWITVSDVDS